jgi:hypothetical protein
MTYMSSFRSRRWSAVDKGVNAVLIIVAVLMTLVVVLIVGAEP